MRERRHDEDDIWQGLRLTGVALGVAIVTASLVIVGGGALVDHGLDHGPGAGNPSPLILTAASR